MHKPGSGCYSITLLKILKDVKKKIKEKEGEKSKKKLKWKRKFLKNQEKVKKKNLSTSLPASTCKINLVCL